jgi:Fibronectin type III domain
VTATFGNGSAAVTWQQPATDGGSPMTSYTVTSQVISPGGGTTPQVTVPASTTTTMVNGLTNGATYQFFVTATNAIGAGQQSALSNPVTPVLQPANPNNTGAGATSLGIVNCGASVSATGDNTTGTHAWYTFTFNQAAFPAAPCTLTVNLSGPDVFDVHVGAFTQTPSPPIGETNFSTTTGGTYFIDVYGDTGGNNFNLAVHAQ